MPDQKSHVSWGSVAGVLNIATPHSSKTLEVSVLDSTSGRTVPGVISAERNPEIHRTAREALGSRVLIGGRIQRNDQGQAVHIDVERIRVLGPADAPKAKLGDLLGAVPDLLEGQTVEEYLGRPATPGGTPATPKEDRP